jgi:hypothetical protein
METNLGKWSSKSKTQGASECGLIEWNQLVIENYVTTSS